MTDVTNTNNPEHDTNSQLANQPGYATETPENSVEGVEDANPTEEPEEGQPEEHEEMAEVVENKVTFKFRIPKGKKPDGTAYTEADRRPPVTLTLPYLTFAGLVTALNSGDEKVIDYVVDIVNDTIKEAAAEQVNDVDKPVKTQEELDESKLTLAYLANVIKERKSSGISKEDWAEFKKDYVETMPALTGKDLDKVERAAAIFVNRFQSVKTSKKIISTLRPMLDTWLNAKSEEDKERWAAIYSFLDKKADEFLAVDDDDYLAKLV